MIQQGFDAFLRRNQGKIILVVTVAVEQPKFLGTLETLADDSIWLREQSSNRLICLRKEAIVSVEESPIA